MPRTTLIAVQSLDGAWRTGAVSSLILKGLLAAARIENGWTDIPELRRRRVPGLRWAETAALVEQVRVSKKPTGFAILATPALQARLLEGGVSSSGLDLLVLHRPEIVLGPQRATLAAPFTPADGKRVHFRLISSRAIGEGQLSNYRQFSSGKKSIPR